MEMEFAKVPSPILREKSRASNFIIEEETKQFDQRFNTGKNRMFELNLNTDSNNLEYPPMSIKEVMTKDTL
jgi:hypothetical protein